MAGKLSTHVLDTYHGCPAVGVAWALDFLNESGGWIRLAAGTTNADGRTQQALLQDDALQTGSYRIVFEVGNYFKEMGVAQSDPPFLDEVMLQVGLTAGQNYHVPLLTSPWSYSTYRGS